MTYISILNYNTGEVFIYTVNDENIEDYEDYITNTLHLSLYDISYMITDTLNVKIQ